MYSQSILDVNRPTSVEVSVQRRWPVIAGSDSPCIWLIEGYIYHEYALVNKSAPDLLVTQREDRNWPIIVFVHGDITIVYFSTLPAFFFVFLYVIKTTK